MIFVKNFKGGREVNMINTLSKINLSKIGWEEGGSTSIGIMSLNILFVFLTAPLICFKRLTVRKCPFSNNEMRATGNTR